MTIETVDSDAPLDLAPLKKKIAELDGQIDHCNRKLSEALVARRHCIELLETMDTARQEPSA